MEKYWKTYLSVALFSALTWLDYKDLGDVFRQGKIRYALLALSPIIFMALKKRLTWAPAAFGALAWTSFVLHDYMVFAEFPVIQILGCLGLAAALVSLPVEHLGRTLMLAGLFQAVLGIFQWFGVYAFFLPVKAEDVNVVVGLMGHKTVLGPFLCACLAPALWRKNYVAAAIIAVCILLTKSSMTAASLGAISSIFVWHRYGFRMAAGFTLAALGIVGVAFMSLPGIAFFSGDGRGFIWSFGWKAFLAAPWFGGGVGSWSGVYLPAFKAEILTQFHYHLPFQLHNDYLEFLVEYGAAPFVGILLAAAHFVKNFKPTWHHAACASLMVNATANFPLCLISHALIFVVCWAHSMNGDSHGMARNRLDCV